MNVATRRLWLTAHLVFSVGWLGAVIAFEALAVNGLLSHDARAVMASDVAMNEIAKSAIAPLCVASFATGIVQSLVTPWGLFRHYWIMIKLLLTVISTVLLLVHLQPIDQLAQSVLSQTSTSGDLRILRRSIAIEGGVALLALLAMTILSIYKPPGVMISRKSIADT